MAERIQRAIDQEKGLIKANEQQLQRLNHQKTNLDARKKGLIDSISRWRTERLINGGPSDDVSIQIINMLDRRQQYMTDSQAGLDELIKQIEQTRVMQRTNEKMVTQRKAEADEAQQSNPELTALRAEVGTLGRLIPEQTEMLDNIRDECRKKLHGYAGCQFFTHLNKRSFSTDKYKSLWPFSLMDAWLAKTIDYPQMIRDHTVLLTLPTMAEKKLDETTSRYNALRNELEALLYRMDQASGVVEATQRLERSTVQLEQLEREHAKLLVEVEDFKTNKDASARAIEKAMANNLMRLSLSTIKRMANQAPSAAESSAMKEYVELMQEPVLDDAIVQAQDLLNERNHNDKRLERLLTQFKRREFSQSRVAFRHSFDVERFIGQMEGEDQMVRHVHAFSNARQILTDTDQSNSASDSASDSGSGSSGIDSISSSHGSGYGGYGSSMDSGSSSSSSSDGGGGCG